MIEFEQYFDRFQKGVAFKIMMVPLTIDKIRFSEPQTWNLCE